MSYEIAGKIIFIGQITQVTETFRKRDFVIEKSETVGDRTFASYIKMQLTQDRTDALNGYGLGDNVKCHFNLRGNKSLKNGVTNYFTNIECWKIEPALQQPGIAYQQRAAQAAGKAYQQPTTPAMQASDSDISDDDLPF